MLETLDNLHQDIKEFIIFLAPASHISYILFINPDQLQNYIFVDYLQSYKNTLATISPKHASELGSNTIEGLKFGPFQFINTQQIIDKLHTISLLK